MTAKRPSSETRANLLNGSAEAGRADTVIFVSSPKTRQADDHSPEESRNRNEKRIAESKPCSRTEHRTAEAPEARPGPSADGTSARGSMSFQPSSRFGQLLLQRSDARQSIVPFHDEVVGLCGAVIPIRVAHSWG